MPIGAPELREAASKGVEDVKRLLLQPEHPGEVPDRARQLERARTALQIMTQEGLQDIERKIIITATREIIQNAINMVTVELREAADKKMEAMRKNLETEQQQLLATRRQILDEESKVSSFPQKVLNEARETVHEMKNEDWRDWKNWAKYGSLAVAGAIAAKWVWDHTLGWTIDKVWGNKEHPGFFRRALGVGAAALGAVAGAVGIHLYRNRSGHPFVEVGGFAMEMLSEAAKRLLKNVPQRLKDLIFKQGLHTQNVLLGKETYTGDLTTDFLLALTHDGLGEFVIGGGGGYLVNSGIDLIWNIPSDMYAGLQKAFEGDFKGAGKAIVCAYVGSMLVWATSYGAIEWFFRGQPILRSSVFWPYRIYANTPLRGIVDRNVAAPLLNRIGLDRAALYREIRGNMATFSQLSREESALFRAVRSGEVTEEATAALLNHFHQIDNYYYAFKEGKLISYTESAEAKRLFEDVVRTRERFLERLQKAFENLHSRGKLPSWVSNDIAGQLRAGKINVTNFEKSVQAMAEKRSPAIAVTAQPQVGPAMKPGQILSSSAKVQEVLKTVPLSPRLAKALDESPEFAKLFARHLETAADPSKLVRAMNAASASAEDASFIGKVMGTESGFARVVSDMEKGTDIVKALGSASKMSRVGQALRFSGRAAPIVLDALVIYGTVMEIAETSEHIAKLRREGKVREEVIRLEEKRYYYQGAQLGVSGIGFGAGCVMLAGAGSTVALPVTLATLPISAIIYGAYEQHKWKEAQARTSEDWKNEFDLITLLTDIRDYSFGERTGHVWDAAFPTWREYHPLGAFQRLRSGTAQKDIERLVQNIQQVDAGKLRAIIAHTTTVTITETVRGNDGQERSLQPEEVQQYQEELTRYVESKVSFLLSAREDALHPIRSKGDIADLLEGAEHAGLLAKDRPQLQAEYEQLHGDTNPASQKRALKIREILDEKDTMKQAHAYKEFMQREQTGILYATTMIRAAVQEESSREAMHPPLQRDISQLLLSASQHAYTNFCVQCEEANLQNWWPDGEAQKITRLYATERTEEMIKEKSALIATKLLADADEPGERGKLELELALEKAQHDIASFLANPKHVWDTMPAAEKARLGYKFTDESGEKMPEGLAKRIRAGEALLSSIDATSHSSGSWYTKQYGLPINLPLYITFSREQGKWLARLGPPLRDVRDPSSFRCTMWSGTEKYNRLLNDLDAINNDRKPSQ